MWAFPQLLITQAVITAPASYHGDPGSISKSGNAGFVVDRVLFEACFPQSTSTLQPAFIKDELQKRISPFIAITS
jgi:hypothetical protein